MAIQISPDETRAGLERLAPEHIVLALPVEALRALSDEYIATLPAEVQREIHARRSRAEDGRVWDSSRTASQPAFATIRSTIPAAHRGAQAPKARDLQQLGDRTRNARNLSVQKRIDGIGQSRSAYG